jgi:hypothetical protein
MLCRMGTGGWRMPIVGSPHGSLEPYPNLSLAELMVGSIDRWGDRVALVDGVSGAEYDFRALGRAMQVVGGLLRDDGVEPGDRVAIVAPNSTEWIAAFLGIQAAGAAVTTLSPLSRRREVEQQFADSKPSAVFVGGEATTVVRTLWGSDERIYDMSSVWQMVVQGRWSVQVGSDGPGWRRGRCGLLLRDDGDAQGGNAHQPEPRCQCPPAVGTRAIGRLLRDG